MIAVHRLTFSQLLNHHCLSYHPLTGFAETFISHLYSQIKATSLMEQLRMSPQWALLSFLLPVSYSLIDTPSCLPSIHFSLFVALQLVGTSSGPAFTGRTELTYRTVYSTAYPLRIWITPLQHPLHGQSRLLNHFHIQIILSRNNLYFSLQLRAY